MQATLRFTYKKFSKLQPETFQNCWRKITTPTGSPEYIPTTGSNGEFDIENPQFQLWSQEHWSVTANDWIRCSIYPWSAFEEVEWCMNNSRVKKLTVLLFISIWGRKEKQASLYVMKLLSRTRRSEYLLINRRGEEFELFVSALSSTIQLFFVCFTCKHLSLSCSWIIQVLQQTNSEIIFFPKLCFWN